MKGSGSWWPSSRGKGAGGWGGAAGWDAWTGATEQAGWSTGSKGKRGGKRQVAEHDADDEVSKAAVAALKEIAKHEGKSWSWPKTKSKCAEYLQKGVKGLDMEKDALPQLLEKYADKVFLSIFSAWQDKGWLNLADFLPLLEAGVKQHFPKDKLDSMEPAELSEAVRRAHDRAYEEARFGQIAWEVLEHKLPNKEKRKKFYEALESSRKAAVEEMQRRLADQGGCIHEPEFALEEFVFDWVGAAVDLLGRDPQTNGGLTASAAEAVFTALVDSGSLPVQLMVAA